MTTPLDAVDTSGGITVPQFFNGRILSAEDLRLILTADRRHRALLGRAIGPGVAVGLRVSRRPDGPAGALHVTAGIAVNRKGETVDLPVDLDVQVTGAGAVAAARSAAGPVFADCGGTSPTSTTSNAFLLTVRPDSLDAGSAPADPYLTGQSCGPGFVAEGVRFRRVPLDPTFLASSLGVTGTPNLGTASPRSRNVVSHLFLGSTPWTLFSDVATAGDVDPDLEVAQTLTGLQSCEVPLALFYLQGGSAIEVDEWAVRRPCRPATDDAGGLASFVSPPRTAAGGATYLQFQAQLGDLLATNTGPAPRAATHFRYLPAAGILPARCIGSPTTIATFLSATMPFFGDLTAPSWTRAERPIRSARVESVIRDGTRLPPVDLVTTRGLPLTVLAVHESLAAAEPYAVFISAQHPYTERIDLDKAIDRLAAIEPHDDEEPTLTVVVQDKEILPSFVGVRLAVRYRVFTNTAGRYTLTPTASKKTPVPATLDTFLYGDSPRGLPEGATIVSVDYTIRTNGGVFELVDTTQRRDDPEDVDFRVEVVGEEVDRLPGENRIRRITGGGVNQPISIGGSNLQPSTFILGIEVASLRDPTLTTRVSFGFGG